jgi:hypothetical protein
MMFRKQKIDSPNTNKTLYTPKMSYRPTDVVSKSSVANHLRHKEMQYLSRIPEDNTHIPYPPHLPIMRVVDPAFRDANYHSFVKEHLLRPNTHVDYAGGNPVTLFQNTHGPGSPPRLAPRSVPAGRVFEPPGQRPSTFLHSKKPPTHY